MARRFNCTLCDRNTYTGNIGSTSCQNCGVGAYSHLGFSTCVSCGATAATNANVELYNGGLQGFHLADEVMVGWTGLGVGDEWKVGVTGPLGGSSNVLYDDADGGVVSATVELAFEGMMSLVLRGFGKVDGLEAAGGTASIALLLSMDWITFQEVLLVDLDVSQDGAWQYVEEVFHPSHNQIGKKALVELRSSGGGGSSVHWSGVGLFNSPAMSCGCTDGFYMNLDTPNCRTCTPQPSCRSTHAACYRCPAGHKCAAGVIQTCGNGLYSWGGSRDCEGCEVGWVCENGLTLPCASDGSIEVNGACVACPSGHNCRNGVKKICPVGKYSKGGEGREGKQCINCPPGRYAGNLGSMECTPCQVGKSSGHGHEDCYECGDGASTTSEGEFPCRS